MTRKSKFGKNVKKKSQKTIQVYIGVLLIILLGFLILYLKLSLDRKNPFTVEIDNRALELHDNIDISMVISQSWVSLDRADRFVSGAQYDGVIKNNLGKDIRDWELTIYLPSSGVIDSAWSGNFTEQNDTIIVTPLEYNNLIERDGEQTFGFVLYAQDELEFIRYTMTGYYQISMHQYIMFWVLIFLAVCWLTAIIVHVSVFLKIRKLEKQRQKDQKIISQAMMTFAHLVDAKDEYTKEHSLRVALYAAEIGRRCGMSKEDVKMLKYIALVHDCGKIGVPDAILNKKGKLEEEEREIIKSHTVLGGHVLEYFKAIEGIREGALYHHERYDGTGYPNRLKGKEIPLCARIIGVADAYDAMSSDRCYRKRLPTEKIVSELKENSGTQFDPDFVKCMIDMIEDKTVDTIHELELEGVDITEL